MIILKNWFVCSKGGGAENPYFPEIMQPHYLSGEVYGHPRFEDGKFVTTSRIVKVEGRQLTTKSGSVYYLEEPHPEYLEWMKDQGYEYNSDNPIKVKSMLN